VPFPISSVDIVCVPYLIYVVAESIYIHFRLLHFVQFAGLEHQNKDICKVLSCQNDMFKCQHVHVHPTHGIRWRGL
jgi:hypothetical protein